MYFTSNKSTGCETGGAEGAGDGVEGSVCQCHKPLRRYHILPPIDQFLSSVSQQVPPHSEWEAQQSKRQDLSMSSFLPGEPQFTQHRDGCRAAQWASAPNIDVILLISTLSLLLISLISAWSPEKQQQTELFLSRTISFHWLPHTLRETGLIPSYSTIPLHPPFMVYRSALRWYHWDSEALKCTITQNE